MYRLLGCLVVLFCASVFGEHAPLDSPQTSTRPTAERIKPDSRCRYRADLDLTDEKALKKNNMECAIEIEVLRYTIARRLKIPASKINTSPYKEKVDENVKLLWNPDWSFIIRERARRMSRYSAGSGAEHNGFMGTEGAFASTFKDSKFSVQLKSENAWGNAWQGKGIEEIAYNLAEQPGVGWNHHPGHAENVFTDCDMIGIGVHIDDNGYVTSYVQFASKKQS
ncbi:MAG: CAP domain-containing protein [Deltaproteobacteria bacterium]|nr:CAP domain-containing protein [Deltaproteobacteria bacterium]